MTKILYRFTIWIYSLFHRKPNKMLDLNIDTLSAMGLYDGDPVSIWPDVSGKQAPYEIDR